MTSIHERAIDWALDKNYFVSVGDYSNCNMTSTHKFDVELSQDRNEIILAIEATELPNVHIFCSRDNGFFRIALFSVIDGGVPEETINDFIAPPGGEFDVWWESQQRNYEENPYDAAMEDPESER